MSLNATLATWDLPKSIANPREKLFLLSLAKRCGESNVCWPSVACIAKDTGLDRKTIIAMRKSLLAKNLIKYTGRMAGRSNQIPEMQLPYVHDWQTQRNTPSQKQTDKVVDNLANLPVDNSLTRPKSGTGTRPKNGTGTSTENGTRKRSVEFLNGKKSFCDTSQKKSKPVPPSNASSRPAWADKKDIAAASKPQMDRENANATQNDVFKRTPPPPELMNMIKKLKYGISAADKTRYDTQEDVFNIRQ